MLVLLNSLSTTASTQLSKRVWSAHFARDTATLSVYADDSYTVAINGRTALSSTPTCLHTDGLWRCAASSPPAPASSPPAPASSPSVPASALTRLGARASSGSDPLLGKWSGWTIDYGLVPSKIGFSTSFQYFPAPRDLLRFVQSFPDGLATSNTSAAPPVGDGHLDPPQPSPRRGQRTGQQPRPAPPLTEFRSQTIPLSAFPSWTDAGGLDYASWQGRFFRVVSGTGVQRAAIGSEGGARLTFDRTQPSARCEPHAHPNWIVCDSSAHQTWTLRGPRLAGPIVNLT